MLSINPSPAVRPGRGARRRLACLGIVATLIGTAGMAAAGPASADVAQQIRDTQTRLDSLNIQAEAAAERYNAGRIALAAALQRASIARQRLAREETAVAALRQQAGAFAAQAYMSGPAGQGIAILSGSRPDQVLGQLGTLDRISRTQAEVMAGLATARQRQAAAAADAQAAVQQTNATVTSLQSDKQSVETAATQAQGLLADLQAKQARLIQAAKDAVARKAAQAQAAALAEQARQAAVALTAFRAQPVAVEKAVVKAVVKTAVKTAVKAVPSVPSGPSYSGSAAQTAVKVATDQLGKSYVYGASGPDHFDCSGLTMYAYAAAGISLSHFTGAQWNEGRHVSQSELMPGDLVFFGKSLGHMGMYIGNGQFIHAPHTGDVVKINSLSGYYQSEYAGAVRVAG